MSDVNDRIKKILSENSDCRYCGYYIENDEILYVYLFEKDGFTGDCIVIVKENLETGEKDKTVGIGGLIEWGLDLREFHK